MISRHLTAFATVCAAVQLTTSTHAAESTWTFSDRADRFSPKTGAATLGYHDPFAGGWGPFDTLFDTASSFGLPLIDGADPQVMAFPACTPDQGYVITHGFAPNGEYGDLFGITSNYTLVVDILFPASSDAAYRAIAQTDITNSGDGELFVHNTPSGGIGINGNYRGSIVPDTWHRIVWTVRAAPGEGQAARYIDGRFVGAIGTTGSGLEDRFALEEELLLFTDENNETQPGYVASVSLIDRTLSYDEAVALGGPNAAGTDVPGPPPASPPQPLSRPIGAIGHRGASGYAPENTLAAIDRAFADGAAGVELDTHISADGVVVCFHDDQVDRTTDGTGFVDTLTLAELKGLDAGSWFGPAFAGEKIPTLTEALNAAKGKGIVYLDIKTDGQTAGFADAVNASGFPLSDLWFWAPGDPARAAEIRSAIPGAKIVWGAPGDWQNDPAYFDDLRDLGVAGFSFGAGNGTVDPAFVARAQQENMFVEIFTLLDPDAFRNAANSGVDYIETDFPNVVTALQPVLSTPASAPSPPTQTTGLIGAPVLSWLPGQSATAHRVHLGTTDPPPFVAEQPSTLYPTSELAPGTTYFWRIDEVTPTGIVPGEVWQFSTLAPADTSDASEWHLAGDLSNASGNATLTFASDTLTSDETSFETTDGVDVPHIAGSPATFLRIPGFFDPAQGLDLSFTGTPANGGGSFVNQFTFIFDVQVPFFLDWMPFFNTNPGNTNDSDFFVRSSGALGIADLGYAPDNTILPDQWYRVIFSADLSQNTASYYVDGTLAHRATADPQAALDGRFSLYTSTSPAPHVRLFNDNDGETLEVLVANIAFLDQTLDDATATALGAADHRGIFVTGSSSPPLEVTAVTYDSITGQLTLTWTSSAGSQYQLESSSDLASWAPLGAPLTATSGVSTASVDIGTPPTQTGTHFRVRHLP